MNKSMLVVMATLLSATTFAKGGGGRGGGNGGAGNEIVTRGSAAWFLYETSEHKVRALLNEGAMRKEDLTRAEVELTSKTESTVNLEAANDKFSDQCDMYDHWSKSHTVLKKDVRCDGIAYYADRGDLDRGTNAWAVVEAMEHALRLAVTADSKVLDNAKRAVSQFAGSSSTLEVTLAMQDGTELRYDCSVGGSYYSSSVQCSKR